MNRPAALMTCLILAAALAAGAPMAANAQVAPASHGPIDITADQLLVQQGQCMANYSGNAEALQDTSRLRADSLKIFDRPMGGAGASGGPSCGQLDRMEADGQVYYVTPTQVVKADHAVYTAVDTTIVMTGDVVAAQGKNVTAGSRLTINTNTHVATMATDVTGRGAKGRVRSVIFPNNAGAAGQGGLAAPVPPPPRRHRQS